MNLITLTTDLGLRDQYSAVLKGRILQQFRDVRFIDVSHEVEAFNVQQGAHVLRAAWQAFPSGTVHLVAVNMQHTNPLRCIFFALDGHYFAGPDNGIFPLAISNLPRDIFTPAASGNNMEDLAKVVAGLAEGLPLTDIGTVTGNVFMLQDLQAPANDSMIRTRVNYIDHFGNVVLAITTEEFSRVLGDRSFDIEFGKREHISQISGSYSDVPEGEKCCIFNESGHLEIAINKGNAHELLGLKINDTVLIEFT